jgi:nucleotide-binding universal stress UspA family protein
LTRIKPPPRARSTLRFMFRHLLIPTDGSPLAAKGVVAGIALAKALGARVTALHVALAYAPPGVYLPGVPKGKLKRLATAQARQAIAPLEARAAKARVPCDTRIAFGGDPWRAILRAARAARCDAIVMGSHGRSAIGGLILGSEATQVLARCRIPVLVVR